jgi:hypothetical protein
MTVLRERVRTVCGIPCDDGMRFDAESVRVAPIREDALYNGLHVELVGWLGTARSKVRMDVGYGDAVTPATEMRVYPTLLPDVPAPQLRVYPKATVIAEKFEAIVSLGMRNSRMKDYFDLWMLLRSDPQPDPLLAEAIRATCERRGTPVSADWPIGLTAEFAKDDAKSKQWQAFLRKNGLTATTLEEVVADLRAALARPLEMAREARA